MKLLPFVLALTLASCAVFPPTDSAVRDSCENTENSPTKKVGLTLTEAVLSFFLPSVDLGRGTCEKYYKNRSPANGYKYMNEDFQ